MMVVAEIVMEVPHLHGLAPSCTPPHFCLWWGYRQETHCTAWNTEYTACLETGHVCLETGSHILKESILRFSDNGKEYIV